MEGYEDQVHYRSIYTFSSDSLSIDYLGAGRFSTKIQHLSDSTINADSLSIIKYHLKSDTLYLSFTRSRSDSVSLKLLPFKSNSAPISPIVLDTLLVANNWVYEYEGIKFDATFLNKYYNPEIRLSEIQVYYEDRLDRSLELPFWKIESFEKQVLLVIEDPMDNFYANVFYIKKITDNGNISAETWQYDNKYDITFNRRELIDSLELLKRNNKLITSWGLQSAKKSEIKEVDKNDTTLIIFEPMPVWESINLNTVITEADIFNNLLEIKLKSDSSYLLTVEDNIICKGSWILQRNGTVVKLSTEGDMRDDYQVVCNDFAIKEISVDSLIIELMIPLYEGDSMIIDRHYELTFKNMHNNTYE